MRDQQTAVCSCMTSLQAHASADGAYRLGAPQDDRTSPNRESMARGLKTAPPRTRMLANSRLQIEDKYLSLMSAIEIQRCFLAKQYASPASSCSPLTCRLPRATWT